jgi:DNA primase
MSAEALLSRLEGVKQRSADRWSARCPAHEDKSPSLSIREIEGDRTLVHCFSGCQPLDVVRAVGLTLNDLFHDGRVRRQYHDKTRAGKSVPRITAGEKLELVEHELTVAWIIASDFMRRGDLDAEAYERLSVAVGRVGRARHV